MLCSPCSVLGRTSLAPLMSYGLDAPVLVLNRHYQPVRVSRARRALTLLFVGAGKALDHRYEAHDFERWRALGALEGYETVGTMSGPMSLPRLLLLGRYGRIPTTTIRLSRRNVYLRDDFTCQYCGRRMPSKDLNLDHVTPRALGGKATWENLVTSCRRCNFVKGSATPEGAGMNLLRAPVRPNWSTAAALAAAPRRFKEWDPFLAPNVEIAAAAG
jgi:5-methylcytosine-specific restriction endonuclease McrA